MRTTQKIVTVVCAFALFMTFGVTDALCAERDHQNGFFLRLAGGGGYAKTEISDDSGFFDFEFDGSGGDIDIAAHVP